MPKAQKADNAAILGFGSGVADVREAAKDVLNQLFTNLATARAEGGRFFPNGIELISLKVGVKQIAEVSIVVAGEKAPKAEGTAGDLVDAAKRGPEAKGTLPAERDRSTKVPAGVA